jgi:hypothetical protein
LNVALFLLFCNGTSGQPGILNVMVTDPAVINASTPAPLYRDPVYDGAADPVLVWNPSKKAWWLFYTQRRAKIDVPGVEWCHGMEIGVAESVDKGFTWHYIGQLSLSHPDSGLDVYKSEDLESWTYQGKILDKPGTRNSDGTIGKHADVVVCGEKAYIIYFTYPFGQKAGDVNGISPFSNRHTVLQAAELEVNNGILTCDRDKPFKINLERPR